MLSEHPKELAADWKALYDKKLKVCGMTCEEDIKAVNKYLPDYIGFVLFFPEK